MPSCNSVHDSRFSELSNSSRFQNCVQFYPRTSDHPVTGHTRSSLLTAYLLGEFRFLNSQAHKRSIISASALSFFRYLFSISRDQHIMAPNREFITLGRGCAWVDSRVTAYLPHSLASIVRRGGTYAHEWSLSEKSWFRGKNRRYRKKLNAEAKIMDRSCA